MNARTMNQVKRNSGKYRYKINHNSKVKGSFVAGATNYISLSLVRTADPNSVDTIGAIVTGKQIGRAHV